MPRTLRNRIILAVTLGLAIGASITHTVSKQQVSFTGSRQIASESQASGKPLFLGKHLSVISVALQSDPIPESEDSELKITGFVRLNQPTDAEVQYKWNLPEGVYLVEGSLNDSLAKMGPGEVAKTSITIKGFSKESLQLISFQSFVTIGDSQFGNSSIISSRPDDSIEIVTAPSNQKISR